MPNKVRELKQILRKAGFTVRPGKGSHEKWKHPSLAQTIITSGKDSSDAKPYLEKQVADAVAQLNQLESEETES